MADRFTVSLSISGSDINEIIIGNAQRRGARDYQEDSFGYTPLSKAGDEGFAAVVADGMGGLSAGDQVSAYAVSAIIEMCSQIGSAAAVHTKFRQMISEINRKVVLGGSGEVYSRVSFLPRRRSVLVQRRRQPYIHIQERYDISAFGGRELSEQAA